MSENSDNSQIEVVEATPNTLDTTANEVVDNSTSEDQEHQEPKTFTQDELDAKVGERLAKERRKWQREQAQSVQESRPATPPQPNQFASAEEYTKAIINYRAEEIANQRENQKRKTEVDSTYADREEDARVKYSDFEKVTQNPNLRITPEMAEVIKSSDIGTDMAYHLGSNPKESERIANLSPLMQARELGKIESALSSKPATKSTSSAPEPIKPVGSRSTNANINPSDPRSTKTMTTSEWITARNKQVQNKK